MPEKDTKKPAAPGEILELFKGGYLSIAEAIDLLEPAFSHPKQKPVETPTFYRCGICDCFHSIKWNGDCRQDDARFAADELDKKYGPHGWSEVEMPS